MEKQSVHTSPSYTLYIFIWLSLLVGTGLTVAVAGVNLRTFAIVVALLIATVKTTLVIFYFMHLKYEDRLFRIMLIFAISTLAVILSLTFADIIYR